MLTQLCSNKYQDMKIVMKGSLDNIGKPLVKFLVANGHQVKVISSNAKRKNAIESLGGIPEGNYIL